MDGSRPPYQTALFLGVFVAAVVAIVWLLGRAPEAGEAPVAARGEAGAALPAGAGGAAAPGAGARETGDSRTPHTRLPLRLLATVVRENPALSLATIEDTDRTAHQVLNEGQALRAHPRARVARIERGRILIDNDGVREQLVIDHSERAPEELSYAPSPQERERRRDLGRRLRDLTDAGPNARELLARERGGILAEGEVSAVYEDGEMVGVLVDDIRAGGVYDQLGLRNGDVVTNINGVSLAEPTAAAEVLAEFAISDRLTVGVERGDGSEETLSLSTADFTQVVQELE